MSNDNETIEITFKNIKLLQWTPKMDNKNDNTDRKPTFKKWKWQKWTMKNTQKWGIWKDDTKNEQENGNKTKNWSEMKTKKRELTQTMNEEWQCE